mgnify:CR=1 FL=1
MYVFMHIWDETKKMEKVNVMSSSFTTIMREKLRNIPSFSFSYPNLLKLLLFTKFCLLPFLHQSFIKYKHMCTSCFTPSLHTCDTFAPTRADMSLPISFNTIETIAVVVLFPENGNAWIVSIMQYEVQHRGQKNDACTTILDLA